MPDRSPVACRGRSSNQVFSRTFSPEGEYKHETEAASRGVPIPAWADSLPANGAAHMNSACQPPPSRTPSTFHTLAQTDGRRRPEGNRPPRALRAPVPATCQARLSGPLPSRVDALPERNLRLQTEAPRRSDRRRRQGRGFVTGDRAQTGII